jgi:hypothetical protein
MGSNTSSENHSDAYYKLPGYPFVSKCPACENNENITWHHACDSGLEKIDDEGNIHCEKCSLDRFLMELKYDCGQHNNQFLEPNWKRTIYAISQLATTRNLPEDVCEKIIKKIYDHHMSNK